MSDARPALLFYCQHSVGLGHLTRSLALARALSEKFRLVLLSGGRVPREIPLPRGVEVVELPPVGLDPDGALASRDRRRGVERAMELRRGMILDAYRRHRPRVVLIELFPFGRKKFGGELLPLLEQTAENPSRPLVVCSLRDILVGRSDQQEHDERASRLANRWFDAVLVHSDPRFARLEESFRPRTPLRIPVHYTGFVTGQGPGRRPEKDPNGARRCPVLVSAGGGLAGEPLLRAAVEAAPLLGTEGPRMMVIAGPFLPSDAWRALRRGARGQSGLELVRSVPDLRAELEAALGSVSQCGYNTALDLFVCGVPALVVPFSEPGEDEQTRRALRLKRLGAVRVLEPSRLTPAALAREIRCLRDFRPAPIELDLGGANETARLISELDRDSSSSHRRRPRAGRRRPRAASAIRKAHEQLA
ncbi:MAG: glycosyltransferase family protein [Solirubrobacterales bacterium]